MKNINIDTSTLNAITIHVGHLLYIPNSCILNLKARELGSLKRLLLLLFIPFIMAGCSSNADDEKKASKESQEEKEDIVEEDEVITEVISEQEHDIVLFDNEDLKMTLLNSVHERYENTKARDKVELTIELENKNNRSFDLLIDELKLDGVETVSDRTFFDESEIGPNELKNIMLTAYTETHLDDIELNFNEHIKGTVWYSDHERSRITANFSEYITEQ